MQMLTRMNAKLDIGWKMTNVSCPACNGTSLAQPGQEIEEIYCPKCDKMFPFDELQDDQAEEPQQKLVPKGEDEQNYYEEVFKSYKPGTGSLVSTLKKNHEEQPTLSQDAINERQINRSLAKTNDVSKKIGQKLMQGWTMLNESCMDCLAPLMKSKKGQKICFGCNRDYAKIEAPIPEKKVNSVVAQVKKQKIAENIPSRIESQQRKDPQLKDGDILTQIEKKALIFLEKKLDSAISDNDLQKIERVLSLVYKIKHSFK